MNQGIIPSPSMLKSELLPSSGNEQEEEMPQTPNFLAVFEDFLVYLAGRGIKKGTLKSYKTTLSRLRRFVATGKKLQIDKYTNPVHQDVMRTLTNLYNLQPNSVLSFCKQLKTFFNYCREHKHLSLHPHHADIKSGFIQTDRLYLTEADLEKLRSVVLNDSMVRIRDAFLFACYTGLRYSDLARIKSEHIMCNYSAYDKN